MRLMHFYALLEVGFIAIDPLGMVAPLGDGVELPGSVITRLAHGGRKACVWPIAVIKDLRRVAIQFETEPVSD